MFKYSGSKFPHLKAKQQKKTGELSWSELSELSKLAISINKAKLSGFKA